MQVTHDVRLLDRGGCGGDVAWFRFSRPEGWVFRAGQWLSLKLPTSEGPESKIFTICSAPGDAYLEIATRLSGSAFKRALDALVVGEAVSVAGPGGRLVLADDIDQVVFLVGGVGVTPARSILRDAGRRHRAFADALVVYGSRDADCVPFLDELEHLGSVGVRVVTVYERPPAHWAGATGFITADLVRSLIEPIEAYHFVVAGPPPMVEAMETVLDALEVSPGRRIIERFGTAARATGQ